MERRAGNMIEKYADDNMRKESHIAYEKEMQEWSNKESDDVSKNVKFDEELGVALIDDEFSGDPNIISSTQLEAESNSSPPQEHASFRHRKRKRDLLLDGAPSPSSKKRLKFLPTSKSGMTVSADHGWQKKGFDSLTGHTFLISKQNKVLKTVITHRTCGKCKWWKRNRPGIRVPAHRCVWNHNGSARSMESQACLEALKAMSDKGTPVQVIEGDGDNTVIARAKNQLGVTITKKLDKNHCIKNIVKSFYDLKSKVKISNQVITHLSKCLKYVFSKNQGNVDNMRENLIALVPHQFGDHTRCNARFCGYKRNNSKDYTHRSLPYKAPLNDSTLYEKLTEIFKPIIDKAPLYVDLGSSQACEHANRAVSLKAPKHIHYGESESLDFRVKAAAASINEGRKYLSEVAVGDVRKLLFSSARFFLTFEQNGLSPGHYNIKHSNKLMSTRLRNSAKAKLPQTKLRRLLLKQERATMKGACEATEGSTYQSEIGMTDSQDIAKIPDPVQKPAFSAVKNLEPHYVVIDLETTGLISRHNMPHITQLACLDTVHKTEFSTYVIPFVTD